MSSPRVNKEYKDQIHFVTITIIEWIDILTKLEYFEMIIDSLKFCQNEKGLEIYEYVIMTNHLHLIVKAKNNNLSQVISDFKKHTTREMFKLLEKDNRKYILNLLKNSFYKKKGYDNQIWQRENYPEIILSDKFFKEKANYIHNNPVKRGFVSKIEDWSYSSAKNWCTNDHSLIKLNSLY